MQAEVKEQTSHLSSSQRALVVLEVQSQLVVGRLQVLVTDLSTQRRGGERQEAGESGSSWGVAALT